MCAGYSLPVSGYQYSHRLDTVIHIPGNSSLCYVDCRDLIERTLRQQPAGLIWKESKERGRLPYNRPCQTWVKQLEHDIGLYRAKGLGRALIWKIPPHPTSPVGSRQVAGGSFRYTLPRTPVDSKQGQWQ